MIFFNTQVRIDIADTPKVTRRPHNQQLERIIDSLQYNFYSDNGEIGVDASCVHCVAPNLTKDYWEKLTTIVSDKGLRCNRVETPIWEIGNLTEGFCDIEN